MNAFGAEERYKGTDPKKRPDARYPVESGTWDGRAVLGGNGPLGTITAISYGTGLPLPVFGVQEGTTYRFDYNPSELVSVAGETEQTAVNAFYNVSRTALYFKDTFVLSAWAKDGTELRIHRNSNESNGNTKSNRGNAFFDASDATLTIGDGKMNADQTAWERQSAAVNVDFIAHEYSHGVAFAITSGRTRSQRLPFLRFNGEAGAINEECPTSSLPTPRRASPRTAVGSLDSQKAFAATTSRSDTTYIPRGESTAAPYTCPRRGHSTTRTTREMSTSIQRW